MVKVLALSARCRVLQIFLSSNGGYKMYKLLIYYSRAKDISKHFSINVKIPLKLIQPKPLPAFVSIK